MAGSRRSGPLLALGACLVGLAAWLLLGRLDEAPSADGVDGSSREDEAAPEEVSVPSLAGGGRATGAGRRKPEDATRAPDASSGEPLPAPVGTTVEELDPTAALVVDVEPPTPRPLTEGAPQPGGIELRLVDPLGRLIKSTRDLGSDAQQTHSLLADGRTQNGTARHEPGSDSRTAATWQLDDLVPGMYAVSAGTPGLAHPGWMPVYVTLAAGETKHVRLRAMLDVERGAVDVALLRGGAKLQATFTAWVRGIPISMVTANAGSDGHFELPVGETVSIEVTSFDVVKSVGRPPVQTVIVPAGTSARADFEVPLLIELRLVSTRSDIGDKPTARAFLWRLSDTGVPTFAGSADGDLKEGIPFTVAPGRHAVQLTDVRGFLPSWTSFVASIATNPDAIEVELGAAAQPARIRLEQADGTPAVNESVWIGRLGGRDPSEIAVGNGKSDASGIVLLPTLPDGEYRVAINSLWHAVELRAGTTPTLRLPAEPLPWAQDPPPQGRIDGIVFAPDGRGLLDMFVVLYDAPGGWGRYVGFTPNGTFAFENVAPGDFVLEVPWSQLRTQSHAAARCTLRIKAGARRSVVLHLDR